MINEVEPLFISFWLFYALFYKVPVIFIKCLKYFVHFSIELSAFLKHQF